MKQPYIIIFLLSTLFSTTSFAQKSGCKIQINQLLTPISTALNKNDFTNLENLLDQVDNSCGTTEFVNRIRILSLMIQKKPALSAINSYYEKGFDKKLIDRLDAAASTNANQRYSVADSIYEFLPLNHAIDNLVKSKATSLLGSDIYKLNLEEENVAYLFSDHVKTYLSRRGLMRIEKNGASSRRNISQTQGGNDVGGFFISAGLHTPLNAVNPTFGTNPVFGVGYMSSLSGHFLYDVFLKYKSNSNSRDFWYLYDGYEELVKSKYSFQLGTTVGFKFFDNGSTKSALKFGLASESVNTGLSTTYYEDNGVWSTSSTSYHFHQTINVLAGVSIFQHVIGTKQVGVNGYYIFAPYSSGRQMVTDITPNYINLELFFKF